MSRIPDDPENPRPRPKRPAGGSRPPSGGDGGSTFRPNPTYSAGGGGGAGGGAARSKGPADRPTKSRSGSPGVGFREVLAPEAKWYERILFGKVSSGQLAQFCRQFAAYLSAGVAYDKTLTSLSQQFARSALGPVVGRMKQAIKAGSTLEEAMAREPAAFNTMFLSMIRVAEARGGVPETLRMMGDYYESRQRMIRQARSAMIYPTIVLTMAIAVGLLIAIFLLPMFADMLKELGRRGGGLPLPSRALMAFSDFVRTPYGLIMIGMVLVGGPFLLLRYYRTPGGKATLDPLIMRFPVFGQLLRKLDISRFARTLSALLDAGVGVGESMDLTAGVMTLTPMRHVLEAAKDDVMHGKELSKALVPSGLFPADVLAVLESGEETGQTPEVLAHLADDYDEQVEVMVKSLGHLVQPLVTVFVGAIVLFIILAVFLPYIQMITGLSGG
ncbi:Type II secretion system protein F [Aquisphaera giovannonii]|uniref:Type II secretion system protein F n=1 Tax=Aquisphaera giovannonii TaxID=406548 RepID=A0A5B9VWP7_9BACT|nr:type II secretion system F family protein [Aquisphaera giovannonii]QEH32662.1 Type II secretion system protein F [Aquisphaera giovannonii]